MTVGGIPVAFAGILLGLAGVAAYFVVRLFTRWLGGGRLWSVVILSAAAFYYACGAFASSLVCGFDILRDAAEEGYQQVCGVLMTPPAILMTASTAFAPAFILLVALSLGTVFAAAYLAAETIWRRLVT